MREAKKGFSLGKFFSRFGIFVVLLAMVLFLSVMSKNFFTASNFLNILRQVAINGILSLGMTFVLVTGGIDLSVGSVLALSSVVAATFGHPEPHYPIVLVVAIAIGIGAFCGAINGVLVSRTTINPFIVTLGMMTSARGVSLLFTNGRPITDQSEAFTFLGRGTVGPITFPVIILIIVSVISVVLLQKSKFGRHTFAVGGNAQSARVSGINVANIKMMVYIYSGALAGLAGILLAARTNAANPNTGSGYELDAIAAAVIGGTSTSGGKGGVYGTLVGALIMTVLSNGMDILNVSSYIQQIMKGIIIVGAVYIDQVNSCKK